MVACEIKCQNDFKIILFHMQPQFNLIRRRMWSAFNWKAMWYILPLRH